jgi:hypothetical protein
VAILWNFGLSKWLTERRLARIAALRAAGGAKAAAAADAAAAPAEPAKVEAVDPAPAASDDKPSRRPPGKKRKRR